MKYRVVAENGNVLHETDSLTEARAYIKFFAPGTYIEERIDN